MDYFKKLNSGTSYIRYYSKLPDNLSLNKEEFHQLWNLKPDNLGKLKMFGKEINSPRWFQNYGHNYRFSNLDHVSKPVPEILQRYLEKE